MLQQTPLDVTSPPTTFGIVILTDALVCVIDVASDIDILVTFGAEIICPLLVLPNPEPLAPYLSVALEGTTIR